MACDVSSFEQVQSTIQQIVKTFGRLDIALPQDL
jgi:NAD(P)-dependent dehydrogenase (short-subunit alcohol dehydrogenase family)